MLKSNHESSEPTITGYSDKNTVMFDFDNISLEDVRHCCNLVMEYYHLGGYVILESSKNHYHAIFDKYVSQLTRISITGWICIVGLKCGMIGLEWDKEHTREYARSRIEAMKWAIMQDIKRGPTLRFSNKGSKGPPSFIESYGTQNHMIARYWETRKLFEEKQD